MKLHTLSGVSINNDKYAKLVVDGYFSRSGWFPLKVHAEQTSEGIRINEDFKVIKTKEKGTIMLVPSQTASNRVLLAGQVWGGFRGGASVNSEHTNGNVLWSVTSSKHCKGMVAVLAILDIGQQIVFHSYGRRHDLYIVMQNEAGAVKRQEFQGDEWVAYLDSVTSEETEEL
jgi:hypothetical protein